MVVLLLSLAVAPRGAEGGALFHLFESLEAGHGIRAAGCGGGATTRHGREGRMWGGGFFEPHFGADGPPAELQQRGTDRAKLEGERPVQRLRENDVLDVRVIAAATIAAGMIFCPAFGQVDPHFLRKLRRRLVANVVIITAVIIVVVIIIVVATVLTITPVVVIFFTVIVIIVLC